MPVRRLWLAAAATAATVAAIAVAFSLSATPAAAIPRLPTGEIDYGNLAGVTCQFVVPEEASYPEAQVINQSGVAIPPLTPVTLVAANGWTNTTSWSTELRNKQVLSMLVMKGVSAGMGCTVLLGQPGSTPK